LIAVVGQSKKLSCVKLRTALSGHIDLEKDHEKQARMMCRIGVFLVKSLLLLIETFKSKVGAYKPLGRLS
jgi:hypothetical protein